MRNRLEHIERCNHATDRPRLILFFWSYYYTLISIHSFYLFFNISTAVFDLLGTIFFILTCRFRKEGWHRRCFRPSVRHHFDLAVSRPFALVSNRRGFSPSKFFETQKSPLKRRLFGGEGGIRTLDTLLTYTPLAGERLQPLGHFTINFYTGIFTLIDKRSQVARCCEAFAFCLYEITLWAPKIEILSATSPYYLNVLTKMPLESR